MSLHDVLTGKNDAAVGHLLSKNKKHVLAACGMRSRRSPSEGSGRYLGEMFPVVKKGEEQQTKRGIKKGIQMTLDGRTYYALPVTRVLVAPIVARAIVVLTFGGQPKL